MRARGELPAALAKAASVGASAKGSKETSAKEEAQATAVEVGATEADEPVPEVKVSRKERLAAEARTWSKQELRWEKERRRKANRAKKVKRRKSEDGEGDGGAEAADERSK